jgi:hypothetical protein
VNLDVFELLERLNEGYRPTVEEVQALQVKAGIKTSRLQRKTPDIHMDWSAVSPPVGTMKCTWG